MNITNLLQKLKTLLSYLVVPVSVFIGGAAVLLVLGVVQDRGWLTADHQHETAAPGAADVSYICPMMCVAPVQEPGRCPICFMELVPAIGAEGPGDGQSVTIDPVARRVAGIQTSVVRSSTANRTIDTVGELQYNEESLRTLTAYAAGRIEKLYVNVTGASVAQGDSLASLYSPQLYAAQVELLQAQKATATAGTLPAIRRANQSLRDNARLKLVEFGMTPDQIDQLVRSGRAESRIQIAAPMSGTVIERLVAEGDSVSEGESLFRLANLSSVWLLLQLYPEDAAAVRYAQRVQASIQSLPGTVFEGRVAYVDNEVNRDSRTVSVRVIMDNPEGQLRPGDFATATLQVPVAGFDRPAIYDEQLAGRWISSRHPFVLRDGPGECPITGTDLVPTFQFGYSETPTSIADAQRILVPRNAVLQAAGHSVVYAETEPGRFELRPLQTGATVGDQVVVLRGLQEGEVVATDGAFLIDSQMQLAGNPSLIDPDRLLPQRPEKIELDATMLAELQKLPATERDAALQQVICPVTEYRLGSMGVPPKATIDGQTVFMCCEGCRERLMKTPDNFLPRLTVTPQAESQDSAGQQHDSPNDPSAAESSADDKSDGVPTPPPFPAKPTQAAESKKEPQRDLSRKSDVADESGAAK